MISAILTAMLPGAGSIPDHATLTVYVADKNVGVAAVTQHLTPTGGKYIELVMKLRVRNQVNVVRLQDTFGPQGQPIREVMTQGTQGRPFTHEVVATFNRAGADVVVKEHDVPRVLHVPLSVGEPRNQAWEMWFVKTHPKPGVERKAYGFNPNTLRWDLIDVKYIGRTQRGYVMKTIRHDRIGHSVVDANGLPIEVDESGGIRMVRVPSGK